MSFRIYLPICSSTANSFCIEGISVASTPNSALQPGVFVGYTGSKTFPADPNRGFPEASTTSRWKVAGVVNKGGTDLYAAKVLLDGFLTSSMKSPFVFDVSAIVEPYKEATNVSDTNSCDSWQLETLCGQKVEFNDGQMLSLSLRLPNTITGWLHGRLKNASIAVDKYDSVQNKLTVTAETVKIPELNVNLTESQFKSLPNPSYFTPNGEHWNSVNAGNTAALEWVKQLSGVLNNSATGEHSAWSFSTIPANNGSNQCFKDTSRLIGLVTTNALVYSPGAPEFDGSQLNYQVGSLHFQKDGVTQNIGVYDLLMRSDTARCLYNFTDAPLSASVSVSYPDGAVKQIATTFLNERNGWLHLGAYGFSFSNPVIKVKLTGVSKSGSKSSTNSKSSAPSNSKGYALTCVKGKQVKKIIAAKPICPSGWIKK